MSTRIEPTPYGTVNVFDEKRKKLVAIATTLDEAQRIALALDLAQDLSPTDLMLVARSAQARRALANIAEATRASLEVCAAGVFDLAGVPR